MFTPLYTLVAIIGVLTLVAGSGVGPVAVAGAVAGAAAGAAAGAVAVLLRTGSFCSLPHIYIYLYAPLYLGVLTLVAAGRVAAPDANRITLKRIVLTALPYKLKKVF